MILRVDPLSNSNDPPQSPHEGVPVREPLPEPVFHGGGEGIDSNVETHRLRLFPLPFEPGQGFGEKIVGKSGFLG